MNCFNKGSLIDKNKLYRKIDKKNDKSGCFLEHHITIKTTFTIFMESK